MRRQEDPSRLPSLPLAREMGDDLPSSLYQGLNRLTEGKMRFKCRNHTLQSTALVNEASLRPEPRARPTRKHNTPHSRRYARAHRDGKRGDALVQVTLIEDRVEGVNSSTDDILAVDEALTRLTEFDPRQANELSL